MNKRDSMDVMMNMQRDAWRQRQPIVSTEEPKVVKVYDASEIYDNPAEYSTIHGIFRYVGIEVI